jgi:hypothetical protein
MATLALLDAYPWKRQASNSAKLGVPNAAIGKMVTTRPNTISYLDQADLSTLDASAGNPFEAMRTSQVLSPYAFLLQEIFLVQEILTIETAPQAATILPDADSAFCRDRKRRSMSRAGSGRLNR